MVYLHGETVSLSPSQEILRLLRNAGFLTFSVGIDPCPSTVPGSIPGGVTGFFSDIFLPIVPWPWGRLSP